jgi:polyphenol oxidase
MNSSRFLAPGVLHPDWLVPDWALPGVGACMTTRQGGVSTAPFDSLNLRHGVGDAPQAVAHNWRIFTRSLGTEPVVLNQVHGAAVMRLTAINSPRVAPPTADACYTTDPGVVCSVQVADCLPVLFAAVQNGTVTAVAAAHAGWRGLAGGVLENTLAAVCSAAQCLPGQVHAWLGACIGPDAFEVGVDVLQAFGALPEGSSHPYARVNPRYFRPHHVKPSHVDPTKWWANLPALAADRLQVQGVQHISGGSWCTVSQPDRFFSFRRDGRTGRMAAAVWMHAGQGA